MIPILLLVGAVVLGTGLLATFWNKFIEWINRAAEKIKSLIKGVIQGVKIFIKKMREAYQEISRYYSQSGTMWEENIVTRTIPANEVPSDIRERADYSEREFTNELRMQIAN